MEGRAMKRKRQEATRNWKSQAGTCDKHGGTYGLWCESCDVPACRKCLVLKHKGCELVLIEDKHRLREQQQANHLLLKKKMKKYCEGSTINDGNLAYVRFLVEKLTSVEIKMVDYQNKVKAWKTKAQKLLSSSNSPSVLSKVTKEEDSEQKELLVLEELERKIRSRPSSVLVHVAATYQISGEDVGAFVVALQSGVEARRAEGPSGDEDPADKGSKHSFQEAVAALTEGEDWVVSDATSAAAVRRVLETTSVRPAKVVVASNNIPDELLSELKFFFYHDKEYPVEASETLPSFPTSSAPCSDTRASSTARLDAWIAPAGWCSLTQFWGHLDAAAVQKLPATIKSLGLVLRDQEDMAAVNALSGVAFEDDGACGRSCLLWPGWTDLNLSVAKTFKPDHWKEAWRFCTWGYLDREWSPTIVYMPTALSSLGIRLCLTLTQLVPGDRYWMRDIFEVMKLRGGGNPLPLMLPGALIDPDSLLGVLRDSGQAWEVHLPASIPQLVAREEVTERYKEHGHCVTWDLE